MSKMRVHQLAKELELTSKEVVAKAQELGIEVKNHMSSLEDEVAQTLRDSFASASAPAAPAPESPPEPPPEPDGNVALPKEGEESEESKGGDDEQPRSHRRGRRSPLSQEDPFWQFGTPVESWGSSRGAKAEEGDTQPRDSSGLAPDDPYWTFGAPVSSWGSTKKKVKQDHRPRQRAYIECRTCGVKIEKKRAHKGRKIPCPFCNKWMREYR